MGQRTCLIVQKHDKESDKRQTRVFYCGWGIGRILPSQLIAILNGTLSTRPYSEDFIKSLKPQGTQDIAEHYTEEQLSDADFDKPILVGNIIEDADNNNGGLFVKITATGKMGEDIELIEYAYMLGHEEGGDYKQFCTAEDWFEKVGGEYIDDDFRAIYDATLRYFEAKEHAITK